MEITVNEVQITAGGGALDINIARLAADAHLAGLEFLSGIPGTIGGAVRMNAGAYGSDLGSAIDTVTLLDRAGGQATLGRDALGFAYRESRLPLGGIVVGCTLTATPGDPVAIHTQMTEIKQAREATQPVRTRTGGSTFRNPGGPDDDAPRAWQLIDAAGCRGLTRGGAMVSPVHCNFLENTGRASAADLEALGEEVCQRVVEQTGVNLQWEIERIGDPIRGML